MGLDMTTDRVFVLLMMVLLMMAGCFEATSTTEAEEEQDSTTGNDGTSDNVPNDDSDDDSSSNDPIDSSNGQGSDSTNSGTTTSNSQERTWYSSGWTFDSTWSDGVTTSTSEQRCMEWGPLYDSETGEFIRDDCKRYGFAEYESDWNTTNCTSIGGTPYWNNLDSYTYYVDGKNYGYRWAPKCINIPLMTINTNAGQALLIYQKSGSITWNTICDGVSQTVTKGSGSEYTIVPGSSMNCTHELIRSPVYYEYNFGDNNYSSNYSYDQDGIITQSMWSIVYALQDTVVV